MLGPDQEAWLAAQLRTSEARWKLVGQGVMFAHLKLQGAPLAAGGGLFVNSDQWDGYQPARDRLYSVLKGDTTHPPVNNVVVLTGDIHSSWAADLTQDPNNPDLGSGGYQAASGEGSRAVEFIGTSVTSPGLPDPNGSTAAFLRSVNPHLKYIDFNQRGYMLLDVTPRRVVSEWWFVDTVSSISHSRPSAWPSKSSMAATVCKPRYRHQNARTRRHWLPEAAWAGSTASRALSRSRLVSAGRRLPADPRTRT